MKKQQKNNYIIKLTINKKWLVKINSKNGFMDF